MKIANDKQVQRLRKIYKPKTVVELSATMEDPYHPLPAGIRGECCGVDDAGQILVRWNNGSSLSLIPGMDSIRIVK